jgi:low affinity Fe/Cu permease
MRIHHLFTQFARWAARKAGHPLTFFSAVAIIVLWALTGPLFGYSDTWQLIINTGTTIVTFLMVFLIQHTQNTDTEALHLKLDPSRSPRRWRCGCPAARSHACGTPGRKR